MGFPVFSRAYPSLAALAFLAGCAGGQSSSGIPPTASSASQAVAFGAALLVDPSRASSTLYASTFNPSQVNGYALPDKRNVAPACTFATSYVFDMGVDSHGTLWVPQANPNVVTTYKKGTCTPAALTLNEPANLGADIAFSSAGTVYLLMIGGSSGGYASVYPKGAKNPTRSLTDPAIGGAGGIAVDAAGDVFISYLNQQNQSAIIEFKNGRMPGTVLALTGLSFVEGLEFDSHQNLVAIDFGSQQAEIFAPPYAGAPASTFPLAGTSQYGKLDESNKNLYVADNTTGSIDVYAYPTGTYEYGVTNGLTQANTVEGVAVEPAAKN